MSKSSTRIPTTPPQPLLGFFGSHPPLQATLDEANEGELPPYYIPSRIFILNGTKSSTSRPGGWAQMGAADDDTESLKRPGQGAEAGAAVDHLGLFQERLKSTGKRLEVRSNSFLTNFHQPHPSSKSLTRIFARPPWTRPGSGSCSRSSRPTSRSGSTPRASCGRCTTWRAWSARTETNRTPPASSTVAWLGCVCGSKPGRAWGRRGKGGWCVTSPAFLASSRAALLGQRLFVRGFRGCYGWEGGIVWLLQRTLWWQGGRRNGMTFRNTMSSQKMGAPDFAL
jgi:hypothetical protein